MKLDEMVHINGNSCSLSQKNGDEDLLQRLVSCNSQSFGSGGNVVKRSFVTLWRLGRKVLRKRMD